MPPAPGRAVAQRRAAASLAPARCRRRAYPFAAHERPNAGPRPRVSSARRRPPPKAPAFLLRPAAAARDASPAPLRLALAPARDEPLFVPLSPSPILLDRHGSLDRRASAAPHSRNVRPAVASAIVE
ncbi:hypothetical protein BGLA2_700094 [Burkholderia gladioli]|nr:hypothetical protein BGLA2_700094 [Burkholderia gladioli]